MKPMMSPARARGTRLPQLQDDVTAGAACAPGASEFGPDDWFHQDGEPAAEWVARQVGLKRLCGACPVLAQCHEIGLRLDAPTADDGMFRGGVTGTRLRRIRRGPHRVSLQKAIAADRALLAEDPERLRILQLDRKLRGKELPDDGTRNRGTNIKATPSQELSAELRGLRAVRRQRNGWRQAA